MKNKNETGSIALVALSALTALGLASLYVTNSSQQLKNVTDHARVQRKAEEASIGAMNAISHYKALLSTRKQADGNFIPTLFAKNYYEQVWELKKNATAVTAMKVSPKLTDIPLRAEISNTDAASIMSSGNATAPKETFTVKFERANRDPSNKIVETVEALVTRSVKSSGKTSEMKVRALIRVVPPTPYDPKIFFRKPGGTYKEMVQNDDLTQGPYEFILKVSGVAYNAKLFIDDVETKVPFGGFIDGQITHEAVSYDAKDAFVGPAQLINPSGKPPAPAPVASAPAPSGGGGSTAPASTDGTSCGFTPGSLPSGGGGGTASVPAPPPAPIPAYKATSRFKAIAYGPDGTASDPSEEFIVVTTPPPPPAPPPVPGESAPAGSGRTLTAEDYKTKCTAQCPYLGDVVTGGEIGGYAAFAKNQTDVSSMHTLTEAQNRWGIKDQKVCYNFTARGGAGSGNYDIHNSDIVMYDVNTCKRTFLFQRGACGCVTGETMIRLGDGKSEKRIDQLTEDDQVWNPLLKKSFALRKMTRGPEAKPLIRIRLQGGQIDATSGHPFVSSQGIKAAKNLKAGDSIQTVDGAWKLIESVEDRLPGETLPIVWNLEVEAPDDNHAAHHVLANGIVTGDLLIQTLLEANQGKVADLKISP